MTTVAIRPERPDDTPAIRVLVDAAFAPSTVEGRIVDDLRRDAGWIPELALVAVEDDGRIVGQCVTSAGRLVADDGTSRPILALGPIAVAPDRQRQGIGGDLMRASIAIATALGWPVVVLLGHPAYYPRFGFEPARTIGIDPPVAWSDAAWMARRLPGWTPDVRGTMRYPPAFGID